MIVESYNFDKIAFFLFAFFQLLLNDLLESIDNELLDERGGGVFGLDKLFVGFGVKVEALHVEESEGDVEFGGSREFLYSLFVHSL